MNNRREGFVNQMMMSKLPDGAVSMMNKKFAKFACAHYSNHSDHRKISGIRIKTAYNDRQWMNKG